MKKFKILECLNLEDSENSYENSGRLTSEAFLSEVSNKTRILGTFLLTIITVERKL